MSFWGSKTIIEQQELNKIISPFDLDQVKYGRYQLKVGAEVFVTVDDVKKQINEQEQISIAPGQFAIILTEEKVTIPHDAIGLISIRYGIKLRGLVNVSGFHVDPGFSGKLKFAVYNAGPRPIALTRGEPAFLIWFSKMNGHDNDDTYKGSHNNQDQISSDDINNLHGKVASPSALNEKIEDLKKEFEKTISDTKVDCNSSINELKSNYDSQIESLKDRVNVWRGLLISLIVAVVIMSFKLIFDSVTSQKKDLTNLTPSQINTEITKQVNEAIKAINSHEQHQPHQKNSKPN